MLQCWEASSSRLLCWLPATIRISINPNEGSTDQKANTVVSTTEKSQPLAAYKAHIAFSSSSFNQYLLHQIQFKPPLHKSPSIKFSLHSTSLIQKFVVRMGYWNQSRGQMANRLLSRSPDKALFIMTYWSTWPGQTVKNSLLFLALLLTDYFNNRLH